MLGYHHGVSRHVAWLGAAALLLASSTAEAQTFVAQTYQATPSPGVTVLAGSPNLPGCPTYCMVVNQAPPMPPRRVVAAPQVAHPGHFWVPGHHAWQGAGWHWQPAHWVAHRPGQVWVAPYYHAAPSVYVQGHWAPASHLPHYAHHLEVVAVRAQHRAYRQQLRAQLRAMERAARLQARAHAHAVRAYHHAHYPGHHAHRHAARAQHRAYRQALRQQVQAQRRAARLQERQARRQARARIRAARHRRAHHRQPVVVAQPVHVQAHLAW